MNFDLSSRADQLREQAADLLERPITDAEWERLQDEGAVESALRWIDEEGIDEVARDVLAHMKEWEHRTLSRIGRVGRARPAWQWLKQDWELKREEVLSNYSMRAAEMHPIFGPEIERWRVSHFPDIAWADGKVPDEVTVKDLSEHLAATASAYVSAVEDARAGESGSPEDQMRFASFERLAEFSTKLGKHYGWSDIQTLDQVLKDGWIFNVMLFVLTGQPIWRHAIQVSADADSTNEDFGGRIVLRVEPWVSSEAVRAAYEDTRRMARAGSKKHRPLSLPSLELFDFVSRRLNADDTPIAGLEWDDIWRRWRIHSRNADGLSPYRDATNLREQFTKVKKALFHHRVQGLNGQSFRFHRRMPGIAESVHDDTNVDTNR